MLLPLEGSVGWIVRFFSSTVLVDSDCGMILVEGWIRTVSVISTGFGSVLGWFGLVTVWSSIGWDWGMGREGIFSDVVSLVCFSSFGGFGFGFGLGSVFFVSHYCHHHHYY